MRDPLEGVTATGTITTGAAAERIAPRFRPVLDDAIDMVADAAPGAALFVYGSVATGQARTGSSDVDLLTIDLPADAAAEIESILTARFADLCRSADIGAGTTGELEGESDHAYGGRVFLRHYCVHLTGPRGHQPHVDFPADVRAARGFNGDIAVHAGRWHAALAHDDVDAGDLARRIARKTLLAVAGLVSVHDHTWTTDRDAAASRWKEIDADLAPGLARLREWSGGAGSPDRAAVRAALDDTVAPIVERFADRIGLWASGTVADGV